MDFRDSLSKLLDSGLLQPDAPDAAAPAEEAVPRGSGRLRKVTVAVERKGRGGKCATIIADFPDVMTDADIEALGARLKRRLGTGGSARGGEILIQGDRRTELRPLLEAEGFRFNS